MRILISAGEASGERYGTQLINLSFRSQVLAPQASRRHAEVRKHTHCEYRLRPCVLQDSRTVPAQFAIHLHHLGNCRLPSPRHERVADFPHYTTHSSPVNVGIGSVQVAQRLIQTTPHDSKTNHLCRGFVCAQATARPSSNGILKRGVRGAWRSSCTRERS